MSQTKDYSEPHELVIRRRLRDVLWFAAWLPSTWIKSFCIARARLLMKFAFMCTVRSYFTAPKRNWRDVRKCLIFGLHAKAKVNLVSLWGIPVVSHRNSNESWWQSLNRTLFRFRFLIFTFRTGFRWISFWNSVQLFFPCRAQQRWLIMELDINSFDTNTDDDDERFSLLDLLLTPVFVFLCFFSCTAFLWNNYTLLVFVQSSFAWDRYKEPVSAAL